MELTGPTCDRELNEAEKDGTRERKPGRAGWVRVERKVRRMSLDRFLVRRNREEWF